MFSDGQTTLLMEQRLGCKNSKKSKSVYFVIKISYIKKILSDKQLIRWAFIFLNQNTKGPCAAEICNSRSNISSESSLSESESKSSLTLNILQISYLSILDYINFLMFWFVFQHFTCSTYYRKTARRDRKCPSHLIKDQKCPSDLINDQKCPSDLMKDRNCPSDLIKDRKCRSDLIKDRNCPSNR